MTSPQPRKAAPGDEGSLIAGDARNRVGPDLGVPAAGGRDVEIRGETESAGCFPAILAATLLMGVVLFITFALAAWAIFGKRGELAVRTLRATLIPELEQSRLEPDTKQQILSQLNRFAEDVEQGRLENWQAGGVMQRLVKSPLMQWGDLEFIDLWVQQNLPPPESETIHKQITRFFRAAELDRAIATDLQDILEPVTDRDPDSWFPRLRLPLTESGVREVGERARIVADRAEIPDQAFENVSLPEIIRRLIDLGTSRGAT